MIIFISDLHFTDQTAGPHRIPLAAFRGVFNDINNYFGIPSEVKLVLLGDIFDLVRTAYWLEQIYLNTGTWRKRYIQGALTGFIGLKHVTYAVVYNRFENQYYETWTGTLKEA